MELDGHVSTTDQSEELMLFTLLKHVPVMVGYRPLEMFLLSIKVYHMTDQSISLNITKSGPSKF